MSAVKKNDLKMGRTDELATIAYRLRKLARDCGRENLDHFGSYHNHTTWSDGMLAPAENEIFIDACGSARNSRQKPYERPGLSRKFTLNIEQLGEEFRDAARKYGVKFLPSSDTHRDNERDALVASIHAIASIIHYDLPRKSFKDNRRR